MLSLPFFKNEQYCLLAVLPFQRVGVEFELWMKNSWLKMYWDKIERILIRKGKYFEDLVEGICLPIVKVVSHGPMDAQINYNS